MIDDTLVAGTSIKSSDVVKKLKGPKGTQVKVEIFRNGVDSLLAFEITRDKIPIYSLDAAYMVDEEVGYLRLNRFSRTTFQEFKDGIKKLTNQDMKKLILDLRGNPGGYLTAATKIADEFLSGKKLIVYTEGKAVGRHDYDAGKIGLFEEGHMVVLIDEGSASASEIVAGALKDHGRATIVGRRSFGKGLVQEQIPLNDGSALRLTIARYYTPNGVCIQRSYDEGVEAYYKDYLEVAYNGGEVPDSLEGEIVVDWGILPDVVVKFDTTEKEKTFNMLFNRGILQWFAYDLYAKNPARFDSFEDSRVFCSSFEITEELFTELYDYAITQGAKLKEDELLPAKAKIAIAIKAFISRQKWGNAGYYPVYHEIDDEFERAYLELTGK
jgi:carboxyl-terminal processing protease